MLSNEMKKQLGKILGDDLGGSDITSALLKPEKCSAKIIANEPCIIAGLEEAGFLFRSRKVSAVAKAKDGSPVGTGRTVMLLSGKNRNVLEAERTALNIISRMSAVASACREAKKLAGKTTVALTRKTMPGFNLFDKKAAKLAGVWSHRLNLNEAVLIKDNHLVFFRSPSEAAKKAKKRYPGKMVEVEAESLLQALDAAKEKPNMIMLDNFSPMKAKKAVRELRKSGFSGKIELSGGITPENLGKYSKLGADIVSMGTLTQAAASKNFSLKIGK